MRAPFDSMVRSRSGEPINPINPRGCLVGDKNPKQKTKQGAQKQAVKDAKVAQAKAAAPVSGAKDAGKKK